MNLHDFKKSFYSGLVFFGTITLLSIGYSLVGNLSVADKVGSGSGLTASAWNKIVDGILDINTRLENLTFLGNNVGIGVLSPGQKLSVAGTIESTSGGFKFPDGTIQTSQAGTMINVLTATTNGSSSSLPIQLADAVYSFGTTNSTTDNFTFTKAWTYIIYVWGETWFTSWLPVVNEGGVLTHNYAAAEDLMAVFPLAASNGTTFKFNFTTNQNGVLGLIYKIVRVGD